MYSRATISRAVAEAGQKTNRHLQSRVINVLAAELKKRSDAEAIAIMQGMWDLARKPLKAWM